MEQLGGAKRIPLWPLAVILPVALLLLAACSEPSPTPPPPRVTPSAVQASSQRLHTPALPLSTRSMPSPLPGPTSTPPLASPTAPVTASPAEPVPLPDILARIPLAPTDAGLDDLLLDSAAGRLYVTDTSGQLHVLDPDTFQVLATLPAAGSLTLDAEGNRLYSSGWYNEADVTVIDTDSLTVVGTVSPGGLVAVDGSRDRFYVGQPVTSMMGEDTAGQGPAGVRVYNATTLEEFAQVPQPGIPAYNPLRDELYIVAYTVHVADPDTLEITGDLLPEITTQSLPWCNGCLAATGVHVYPDRNLLVVEITILSAGKGPGTLPPPRFFDAATLEELTDLATIPPVERGCNDRLILSGPADGLIYRGERYSRYVFYNNLLVHDPHGDLETWRDGLPLGITNPNTGQMYLPHGDDTLVLDLATLAPAGTLPPMCIHTLDVMEGRIYALSGRDLVVLSEQGGRPNAPPAEKIGSLPADQILAIQPSMDGAQGGTLFVTTPGRLFRSTDGGQSWVRLRGGLPEGEYLNLDLAISPDFARDATLFVGGHRGDFWGEGVYRSTDGGDSWQPMWQDLIHLRVSDIALSPDYARDGTVLATSNYQRLTPWEGGVALSRSTDRGLSWTLVMTQPQGASLPSPRSLIAAAAPSAGVQFRTADYGRSVERTVDGGQTWEPLVVTRKPGFTAQTALASPTFDSDSTVYVLSEFDLFRSTDGGSTWERWADERLAGRDYTNKLTAAAVSAPQDNGRHQVFIGTAAGEFWTLDPERLTWEPVRRAEQWPTVLEGEWVGEIQVVPNGGVWLGTWGSGLTHYADGEIQARYTITDGLPTQYIGGLALTPDGALWVGGDLPPGAARFDGQAWTPHPFAGGDNVGGVFDVAVGSDGQVWVGAQAPGILRWNGQSWELIADPEGLTGWWIYDVEIDERGTLWCATTRGLVFYSDGTWRGQGGDETKAVAFGPDGAAYVLTSGGIVWRYMGEQWEDLPPPKEVGFLNSLALHVAADGAVWVGSYNGAFRYDGRTWQQFTAQEGLPANGVAAIAEEPGGWLWFGTELGAARIDPATLNLSPVVWPATPTQAPPIPTPRPGASPAPKATPTRTPAPKASPTPKPCLLVPAAPFVSTYAQGRTGERLGCPSAGLATTPAAFQPFERGQMFWRGDEKAIYVLNADGTWARYVDTWDASQPAYDPSLAPPEGLWQPVRGFGVVWRDHLGGPRASIGWAFAAEQPKELVVQRFAGGQMFAGVGEPAFILYAGGTWQSQQQP